MHSSLYPILENAPQSLLADTAQRLLALDYTVLSLDERVQCLYWLVVCGEYVRAVRLAQDLWGAELSSEQQGKVYAAFVRCSAPDPTFIVSSGVPLARWLNMRHKLGQEYLYPSEIRDITFSFDAQQKPCIHFKFVCLACNSTVTVTSKSDFLPYREKKVSHWVCPHCLALCEYDPVKVRQSIFSLYDSFFQSLPRDADGFLSESDAALALLGAFALRPFALVRFLSLYSEKIGHYILNTSIYYSRYLLGQDEPSLDYLGLKPHSPVINATVTEMWKRLLPLSPAAGQIAAMHSTSEHNHTLLQGVDTHNALERYPVAFPFTCKENMIALTHMEKMGIPRGSKLVCWYCRTEDFAKHHFPHAKMDDLQLYRNVALTSFRKAIDYLLTKGYYVLRMGTELNPPLPWQAKNLIDYAKEYRTEFMDVWLFAHADLTLGTSSGIDCIPVVSGRNVLFASFAPMGYTLSFSSKTTTLFEHYYSKKARRRMTLKEIFASGFSTNQLESEFEKNGFRLEKNTEDEILEAVKEKIFLMEGGTRSEEDLQLERAFVSLFDTYKSKLVDYYSPPPLYGTPLHGPKFLAHASSVFLRQYREELLAIGQE